MDPIIGGAILSGIGSWLGGNKEDAMNKEAIAEKKREFNLGSLPGVARQAETSGLRDKLLAIFGQMVGQPWSQFTALAGGNPADPFSGGSRGGALSDPNTATAYKPMTGSPAMGQAGMNPAAMSLPQGYKMGDGGVNPDVYSWLMGQFGYQTPEERAKKDQQGAQGPTSGGGRTNNGFPITSPQGYFGAPGLSSGPAKPTVAPTMPTRPTGLPPGVTVPPLRGLYR